MTKGNRDENPETEATSSLAVAIVTDSEGETDYTKTSEARVAGVLSQ